MPNSRESGFGSIWFLDSLPKQYCQFCICFQSCLLFAFLIGCKHYLALLDVILWLTLVSNNIFMSSLKKIQHKCIQKHVKKQSKLLYAQMKHFIFLKKKNVHVKWICCFMLHGFILPLEIRFPNPFAKPQIETTQCYLHQRFRKWHEGESHSRWQETQ